MVLELVCNHWVWLIIIIHETLPPHACFFLRPRVCVLGFIMSAPSPPISSPVPPVALPTPSPQSSSPESAPLKNPGEYEEIGKKTKGID